MRWSTPWAENIRRVPARGIPCTERGIALWCLRLDTCSGLHRETALIEQTREAALIELGWSSFFGDQVDEDEAGLVPVRIANIHRTRMSGLSAYGPIELVLPATTPSATMRLATSSSPNRTISLFGGGLLAPRSCRGA